MTEEIPTPMAARSRRGSSKAGMASLMPIGTAAPTPLGGMRPLALNPRSIVTRTRCRPLALGQPEKPLPRAAGLVAEAGRLFVAQQAKITQMANTHHGS